MKVKHSFVSSKADGGDATLVRPSDWNAEHSMEGVYVGTRQTALSGRVDSSGYPNFLAAGTGLSVRLYATATPLIPAFAAGFDEGGPVDYAGRIAADANPAWSGLTASSTLYLYIDRNPSTGALAFGFSSLEPLYQYAAPSSPATDRHWFDIPAMKMKRWSGSAWEEKQRVFVGECATGASSVSSVTAYALRGRYESAWTAVAGNTNYSLSHNIGVSYPKAEFFFSLDSAGEDASLAHDMNSFASSTHVGHYARENTAYGTRNVLKFGFQSYTQVYKDATQSGGYYKVIAERRF